MNFFQNHNRITKKSRQTVTSLILLLPATIIMLMITGTGCNGNPTDAPDPLFLMEVPLPTGTSTAAELTIEPGTEYSLPVTIVSTRDRTLNIHLTMDKEEDSPEAIDIVLEDEDIILNEGDSITVTIEYYVGDTVMPGLYHTHLVCTIPEPIKGVAGIARAIDIIIPEVPDSP